MSEDFLVKESKVGDDVIIADVADAVRVPREDIPELRQQLKKYE